MGVGIDTELQERTYSSMGTYTDDEDPGRPLYEHVRTLFGLISIVSKESGRILWRTFIAMVLTLGLAFLLPNRYTATAILTPPDSEPISGLDMLIGSKTGMTQLASSSMSDMLGMRSPGQLYIQQMTSRPVLDRLIERFDLNSVYHSKSLEGTRQALMAATIADEDRKSGAIRVSVTDKSPQRAADLANAYAEESGLLISKVNANSAKREREYFEKQLVDAKAELRKDSGELAAFGMKNSTIDTNAQGTALVTAAATLEAEILSTEAEIKGLLEVYSPQHERVLQMQAKLSELRSQLQKLKGKGNVEAPDGTDTLDGMLRVSPGYLELERKVKSQETVVETLAQQFELSKLQEMHQVSNVQVFDPAVAPERKSTPHRASMTLMIGVLFLLLQSAVIVVRHSWNSLPIDNPWRITLEPAVTTAAGVVNRAKRKLVPRGHGVLARWRERRTEKRDAEKGSDSAD